MKSGESEARPVGSTGRAGRPSKPLITRSAAVSKALAIIDGDGLESLSLGALAKEMGVRAPSLYHHFKDKDELLSQVARALLEEINAEQENWSEDWETRVIELSLATRRVAMRHPNAATLSLRFFPRRLMLPAYENTLKECPYPASAQIILLEVLEKFTYGSSLFAAAAEAYHVQAMPSVDKEHFPKLSLALTEAPADDEIIFVEALKVILAGLRATYGQAEGNKRRARAE